MKPFNLEQALAGKPVVTRDGRPVTQLHLFNIKGPCLFGVVEGELHSWLTDGAGDSTYRLFMASEKKSGWIAICKATNNSKFIAYGSNVFATLKEVQENYRGSEWKHLQIEWEE